MEILITSKKKENAMDEGWRKKRQRAFPCHKTVIPKTFFDYNLPLALAAESLQMVP